MINVLNAVAVTLLAAVLSVVPAALIGRYVPAIFEPGLKPIAVAAWISGLLTWVVAQKMSHRQHEAPPEGGKSTSNGFAIGVTLGLLVLAIGVAVGLHFFGDRLVHLLPTSLYAAH